MAHSRRAMRLLLAAALHNARRFFSHVKLWVGEKGVVTSPQTRHLIIVRNRDYIIISECILCAGRGSDITFPSSTCLRIQSLTIAARKSYVRRFKKSRPLEAANRDSDFSSRR